MTSVSQLLRCVGVRTAERRRAASFRLVNPNYSLPSVKGVDEDADEYDSYQNSDDSDNEDLGDDRTIRQTLFSELTDEHLILTSPLLYGFSLGDKLWRELYVDCT